MKAPSVRIDYPHTRITSLFKQLIGAGLRAVDPQNVLRKNLTRKGTQLQVAGKTYDLARFRKISCVGAGKAAGRMALALEQVLGTHLHGGMVIVQDGYGAPCKNIRILEAAHPVPDHRGVQATKHIISLVQSLTSHDLLIVLISGGASSLLCAPSTGLTLADKQQTTNLLLRSGATIQEVNVIRKHLSAIKGGQLAKSTPARILTLILSDVLGDDLATIGSGPTVPDSSTFQDAKEILKHHKIWTKTPTAVRRHLERGLTARIPETWKPTRQPTSRHQHLILANNRHALEGVATAARKMQFKPIIFPTPLQGEAREIGSILGNLGRDLVEFGNPVRPPACLIAGGEPTVTVKGTGQGGRAQECILAAAQELVGLPKVFVAGFGTDGTDGPTDVAGAIVDGTTVENASSKRLAIQQFLDNHDSYHFFKQVGGHIITGPTGTNVNDIYLVLAL